MDLKRGKAGDNILWKIDGSIDDDSALRFETTVLNSQYSGEDLVLDLSNVKEISSQGLRSLDRIKNEVRNKGADLQVLPPEKHLEKKIMRVLEK